VYHHFSDLINVLAVLSDFFAYDYRTQQITAHLNVGRASDIEPRPIRCVTNYMDWQQWQYSAGWKWENNGDGGWDGIWLEAMG